MAPLGNRTLRRARAPASFDSGGVKVGKRGPKPKPTAAKRLAGNPGKRKLNEHEPQPPKPATIAPPDWLMPDAKKEFRRVAPKLMAMGLLSEMDIIALANYCQAFGLYLQCNRELQDNKSTVTEVVTENGVYLASLPQFNQLMKLLQQMRAWGAEFGLSPSARVGLVPDGPSPKSKLTDFAKQK